MSKHYISPSYRITADLTWTLFRLGLADMLSSEIEALANKMAHMKIRTMKEMGICSAYDYNIMVDFCYTRYNLGLHEQGLDCLEWDHIEPGRHYVKACIRFWQPIDLGLASPTITRIIPSRS